MEIITYFKRMFHGYLIYLKNLNVKQILLLLYKINKIYVKFIMYDCSNIRSSKSFMRKYREDNPI